MKTWAGIDVSKLTLDICWFNEGTPIHLKVTNDLDGFKDLQAKLPERVHAVMEATGAYYLRLAHFLFTQGIPLSVVNPLTVKRYAQMKLARAKTDKYDAALLAGFGASQQPLAWSLPDAGILEMQQLVTLEEQLVVQRGALSNQREAFSHSPFASKRAMGSIETLVKGVDRELMKIQGELDALAQAHYPRTMEILCSVPGVGQKTAQALLVATRGFIEKPNGRSLCSYFGIAPRPYQSGTSIRGRGRISKMGNSGVRKKIYMCALTAARSNAACKVFYERLRKNGKPAKVALIAVAAKLLRQAAAMIRANELFDEKLAMGS